MSAQPVSRKNLPDEIVSLLRDRIFHGEYRPGDRLPPERELALALGTNRNTLREALRALEAQGLVRARQGDGVRVLDFRRTGEMGLLPHFFRAAEPVEQGRLLLDILRVRSLMAVEAVGLACRRADEADLQRVRQGLETLRRAHEKLQAPCGEEEVKALADAELGLYRTITEASHSVAGLWLFNSLEEVSRGFLDAYPGLWLTPESYVERWAGVVEGMSAKDLARAREHMTALLEDTDHMVLELLGEKEQAT